MTTKISLCGEYKLFIADCDKPRGDSGEGERVFGGESIPAIVPDDVICNLVRAGKLPDPYFGKNIERAAEFENKTFKFVKEFDYAFVDEEDGKDGARVRLVIEGADTFAEYYLNGEKIGESDNALVPFSFDITGRLKKGKNEFATIFSSPLKEAEKYSIRPYNVAFSNCYESLFVRKSAASYGWDIIPRAISAGFWRDVYIERVTGGEITDFYFNTVRAEKDVAITVLSVNAVIPEKYLKKCTLRFTGECGENKFVKEFPFGFNARTVYPYIENPEYWYPAGSGEQKLYSGRIEIVCGETLVAEKTFRFGLRKIELKFGEEIAEKGNFEIYVNNRLVRVRGADHTPIDVFHGKDKEKYAEVVGNLAEANCNAVRIWGGGVYEGDELYDLCDEKGIMVWQDIMLACHAYPQTEEFLNKISAETEKIAKRLRNHPSLALWCGSNETDWAYVCVGLDPNDDRVTRQAIKNTLREFDPFGNYLPSTPYFSREFVKKHGRFYFDLKEIEEARVPLPEEHYWWHRDDFLSFTKQNHRFIAETGYSGSPEISSLDKFLPKGWKYENDEDWACHSFPTESSRRTGIDYLFTGVPETNEDLVAASRFYQAEAYKFVSERSRINKNCNGLILWNLRDGFPVLASSIVDYYGKKKTAFYAVKAAFEPIQCFIIRNVEKAKIYIVNDTESAKACEILIKTTEGETLLSGSFAAEKGVAEIAEIPVKTGQTIISEFRDGGKTIRNYAFIYEDKINYPEYKAVYEKTIEKILK